MVRRKVTKSGSRRIARRGWWKISGRRRQREERGKERTGDEPREALSTNEGKGLAKR